MGTMMKAMRNPKKMDDQQVMAAYVKDMTEAKENKQLTEQEAEFGDFLKAQLAKTGKGNDFFASMATKLLIEKRVLSENMVNALRKCMNVEKEPKKEEPIDESTLPKATFKIRQWLMKDRNLDSRIISGIVLKETAKAYLFKGHADMLETQSWCMRCGKPLTQPASYTIGFGEVCADKMMVPYPSDLNEMNSRQRKAYRRKILGVLHNQKFECWIPKSQVEEIVSYETKAK
jgi:hypothetical protein